MVIRSQLLGPADIEAHGRRSIGGTEEKGEEERRNREEWRKGN